MKRPRPVPETPKPVAETPRPGAPRHAKIPAPRPAPVVEDDEPDWEIAPPREEPKKAPVVAAAAEPAKPAERGPQLDGQGKVHVTLAQFLKWQSLAPTGAAAKVMARSNAILTKAINRDAIQHL